MRWTLPHKDTNPLAIRRLSADGAFDQTAIDLMVEAYEAVCQELHLSESKYDPVNETVARSVMDLVRNGERDVERIAKNVIRALMPPAR